MIFAARGVKPIVAYVGGCGASAAYWLASACDRVVVDATAIVGSIGVVMAVPNPAADTAADIEIVSSQSPNKRPDVTTDEGRATMQSTVDALATVFVADVARNRRVSVEDVVSKFGAGGVLVGATAVAAGMADAVGSLESTIASLSTPAAPPPSVHAAARSITKAASAARLSTKATKTMTTTADTAPATDPKPAEPASATPAAEPPADDTQCCGSCKAVGAGSAKYCAGCGAAFPEKKPVDGEEEPPSSEDPEAVATGLKAVTGAKTGRLAVAVAMGWKHKATVGYDALRAENVDLRVDALKLARKCTPAIAADLRKLAALDHGSFVASAKALEAGEPIAGLAAPTVEPAKGDDSPLLHHGKTLAQMTGAERAQLMADNRPLFDALLIEDRKATAR